MSAPLSGQLKSGVCGGCWCPASPERGLWRARGGVLLLQLFPLRNLGRISIFLPNRASKLCCEQFGNSRRVSGSLTPALEPAQALSCLRRTPRTSALN